MTAPRIRVLAAAYAPVPGSNPHSACLLAMIDALRAELDLVTVKTEDLAHVKRIGEARMFRVPVGGGDARELYARAVGRQVHAEPYDVVHVLDPWAGAAIAEHRPDSILIYEAVTYPDDEGDDAWRLAHARTLAEADLVLVPTAAAAAAIELEGVGARVEVVRPSVDVGTYDWVEVPSVGTPRILYLGGFGAARDLATAVEAIGRVAALRPVRALMAGEPDRNRQRALRDIVRAAGLEEVIEVRGEPSARSVPGLIASADVCLAPGRETHPGGPLPHPLFEYLSCYRPVVAANVAGVSELIRDESEGLLYPAGNASAMADAILEVLRDAALRERLMEAGYLRTRSELGSGARRRRLQEIYEVLAPGSQLVDPWRERFEDTTGTLELPVSPTESVTQSVIEATEPPPARLSQPAGPLVRRLSEPPRDTQPGLVVPDTDPGVAD
jgi:glycosyltransferase involved in cell wall biosynthesis